SRDLRNQEPTVVCRRDGAAVADQAGKQCLPDILDVNSSIAERGDLAAVDDAAGEHRRADVVDEETDLENGNRSAVDDAADKAADAGARARCRVGDVFEIDTVGVARARDADRTAVADRAGKHRSAGTVHVKAGVERLDRARVDDVADEGATA